MAWNNGSGSWRYCEGYVYNPFRETLKPPQPQIQPLQQSPEDHLKLMYENLLRMFERLERRLSRRMNLKRLTNCGDQGRNLKAL